MDFIINELNKYIDEDDDNTQNTIEDFFDYLDLPQDSDEAIQYFEGTNVEYGTGREEGLDEFSWEATSYVREAGVDIFFTVPMGK